jgi:hypothetical protein
VALAAAPTVGQAVADAPSDIAVFALPTLANPKVGISNISPGEATLSPGVLAVYHFQIVGIAPGGSAIVTLPFQIDEVDQTPLTGVIRVPAPAEVPEPAAYALLLVGIGLIAFAGGRKAQQG